MVEVLLASAILVIGSVGMILLVINSIATNSRNRVDSSQTMLAESVVEQVNSTVIGKGSSLLTDCAGHSYTLSGVTGGANLNGVGDAIDFGEDIAADTTKADYHMDYTVNVPCNSGGALQAVYDVRWNVQKVGDSTNPTNSYLLTVSAKQKGHGEGNMSFSRPVTLRLMSSN
jgi:Tfp pilus assembly protein PilV